MAKLLAHSRRRELAGREGGRTTPLRKLDGVAPALLRASVDPSQPGPLEAGYAPLPLSRGTSTMKLGVSTMRSIRGSSIPRDRAVRAWISRGPAVWRDPVPAHDLYRRLPPAHARAGPLVGARGPKRLVLDRRKRPRPPSRSSGLGPSRERASPADPRIFVRASPSRRVAPAGVAGRYGQLSRVTCLGGRP